MNRQEILDAAAKCVNGDRDEQYGAPEDSFGRIARFWNEYLHDRSQPSAYADRCFISHRDVAAMLVLVKIARIAGGRLHLDNWIDLAGYAACGGEIECSCKGKNDG